MFRTLWCEYSGPGREHGEFVAQKRRLLSDTVGVATKPFTVRQTSMSPEGAASQSDELTQEGSD